MLIKKDRINCINSFLYIFKTYLLEKNGASFLKQHLKGKVILEAILQNLLKLEGCFPKTSKLATLLEMSEFMSILN